MRVLLCCLVLFLSIKVNDLSGAYGPLNDNGQEATSLDCNQFRIFCEKHSLPLDNIPLLLMNVKGWEAYVIETESKTHILPVLLVGTQNYFGHIMENKDVKSFIKKYCIKIEALSNNQYTFVSSKLWHQLWYQRVIKELL